MKEIRLVILLIMGIILIFDIVWTVSRRKNSKNYYNKLGLVNLSLVLSAQALILNNYLGTAVREDIFPVHDGSIFFILFTLWVTKVYLTDRNITVYNLEEFQLEKILTKLLDQYGLSYSINQDENKTEIALNDKKALIRIKQGVFNRNALDLEFKRFRKINNATNFYKNLKTEVDQLADGGYKYWGLVEVIFSVLLLAITIWSILRW